MANLLKYHHCAKDGSSTEWTKGFKSGFIWFHLVSSFNFMKGCHWFWRWSCRVSLQLNVEALGSGLMSASAKSQLFTKLQMWHFFFLLRVQPLASFALTFCFAGEAWFAKTCCQQGRRRPANRYKTPETNQQAFCLAIWISWGTSDLSESARPIRILQVRELLMIHCCASERAPFFLHVAVEL